MQKLEKISAVFAIIMFITAITLSSCSFVKDTYDYITAEDTVFNEDQFDVFKSELESAKFLQCVIALSETTKEYLVNIDMNTDKITITGEKSLFSSKDVIAEKDIKTNEIKFIKNTSDNMYDLLTKLTGNNIYEIIDYYFDIHELQNAKGQIHDGYNTYLHKYEIKNNKLFYIIGHTSVKHITY